MFSSFSIGSESFSKLSTVRPRGELLVKWSKLLKDVLGFGVQELDFQQLQQIMGTACASRHLPRRSATAVNHGIGPCSDFTALTNRTPQLSPQTFPDSAALSDTHFQIPTYVHPCCTYASVHCIFTSMHLYLCALTFMHQCTNASLSDCNSKFLTTNMRILITVS